MLGQEGERAGAGFNLRRCQPCSMLDPKRTHRYNRRHVRLWDKIRTLMGIEPSSTNRTRKVYRVRVFHPRGVAQSGKRLCKLAQCRAALNHSLGRVRQNEHPGLRNGT